MRRRSMGSAALFILAALGGAGCGGELFGGESGERWVVLDEQNEAEPADPVGAAMEMVGGHWGQEGSGQGCVDQASWLTFERGGTFSYEVAGQHICMGSQPSWLSQCEGDWALLEREGITGRLEYWCQAEPSAMSVPIARTSKGTFAVIDHGTWRELTPIAWRWGGGALVRERIELVEYPPLTEGGPPERHVNEVGSQLVIKTPDGELLGSPEALPDARGGGDPGRGPDVDRRGRGLLLGLERARAGSGGLRARRLAVPRRQGALCARGPLWARSGGHAGVEQLLESGLGSSSVTPTAGGSFASAFGPTLRMDPEHPEAWWGRGPWVSIEDPCQAYERYGDILSPVCP